LKLAVWGVGNKPAPFFIWILKILNNAGVLKDTTYTDFRLKKDHFMAALRQYDVLFRNSFMRQVDRAGKRPPERLMVIFDVTEA
jgi:hypothetical protein